MTDIHFTARSFWNHYYKLPRRVQLTANQQYEVLKQNPSYPSLHFKKVKGTRFWSARVTQDYRALAVSVGKGFQWFWIGTHAEYDQLLKGRR